MIDRVLIVGYGSIGKRHLRLVRESLPEANIWVLRRSACDVVPEFANGCFDSLAEACAFAPQASVVASPAPFHVDTAIALIAAGSHVLVEKPLALTAKDARKILVIASHHQRLLQIGYNLRFLESLEKFGELIQSRIIGNVLSVRSEVGQYLPTWRPETDYRHGVSAQKNLGGGVLLELSHEIDYLQWIFGRIDWVSAWTGQQSSLDIDVEDSAHLLLGFLSNTLGHRLVCTVNMDFIRHDRTRLCTAIGERGSLRWNAVTGEVERLMAGEDEWMLLHKFALHRDDTYRRQWQHFMDCINNDTSPVVSASDGLAVLHIIDAVHQSAFMSGCRVAVENDQ